MCKTCCNSKEKPATLASPTLSNNLILLMKEITKRLRSRKPLGQQSFSARIFIAGTKLPLINMSGRMENE